MIEDGILEITGIVRIDVLRSHSLLEFTTSQVAKTKDVQMVESFIAYKGYNLKVPYIL